jgi:hypothetical protein
MLRSEKVAAIHSSLADAMTALRTRHNHRADLQKVRTNNMQFRPQTTITHRASTTDSVNAVTRHRLLLGVVAAMGTLVAQAAGPQTVKLPMQAVKNYFMESCFTLESGQQLSYELSTRHPIEFNLHHHQADGAMSYPDKLVVKSKHSKQLLAASAGAYCFMALNLNAQPGAFDVVINYEITAR